MHGGFRQKLGPVHSRTIGNSRRTDTAGSWYRDIAVRHPRLKLGGHFLRLAVANDVALPIIESLMAEAQMMIPALDALEKKFPVIFCLSDRDTVDINQRFPRLRNDLQSRYRQ